MPANEVRVGVIASDPLFRAGIVSMLRDEPRIAVRPEQPDLLILVRRNLSVAVLQDLVSSALTEHGERRSLPLVLVTGDLPEAVVWKSLSLGARANVDLADPSMAVRLREAVLRVRAGEALFSPGVQASIARNLEHIVERVMGPLNLSPSGLTAIELDVVGLLAEGLDTEEISARLAYSVRSIKLIIRRLMDRFELKNRVAVVAFAIRIGAL